MRKKQEPITRLLKKVSLRKQPTFGDATSDFPATWSLRNERRNPYWWRVTTQIWVVLQQPPTPVLLTVYFSAALKGLVIGNLFKFFRLDITFAREVCHLGIKMKKIWQSPYSFHYPNGKVPVRMWWQIFQAWINYLIQGFPLQLKMDRLKYLMESVALFLLKTGTFETRFKHITSTHTGRFGSP